MFTLSVVMKLLATFTVSLNLLICCIGRATCDSEYKKLFRDYKVYRIFVDSPADYSILRRIINHHEDLDVWHFAKTTPYFVDVSTGPESNRILKDYIDDRNFTTLVLIDDLGSLISYPEYDKRSTDFSGEIRKRKRSVASDFSLQRYNSLEEINDWLTDLPKNHHNLVELEEIGQSYEKNPIYKLKIGRPARNHRKPSVWIDAGIHSREWLSIATSLFVANELISRYKRDDSTVVDLLNRIDIHVCPVVNPDGYHYSRNVNRLWRKTRSRNEIPLDNNNKLMCVGVDANRNFDYFWGSVDEQSEDGPCSDGYAGPGPISEPETAALASALRRLTPQLMAYVTLHSYGQMWLSPWGYAASKPVSYQRQRDVALLAIDALQSVHGTPYAFGTISDLLYPASGTSVDYAHSLNVTYSYAVELRPGETPGAQNPFRGFLQLEDQIVPTGQETFAALVTLSDEILNEY